MRVMHLGTSAASVAHWQSFLRQRGLYAGSLDGEFGPETARATRAFQRKAGIGADGVAGPETAASAAKHGMVLPHEMFEIGPDRRDVLLEARPYFLVPVDAPEATDRVKRRITRWVVGKNRAITDVYVIIHGWHRNLLAAVAAYDRMAARLALLRRRGRIRPHGDYAPLFLSIHWHSDPGEDGWVDAAGSRSRASFMDHARAVFEPKSRSSRRFTQDFEDIYELLSRMCSHDVPALSSWDNWLLSRRLTAVLDRYRFRDAEDGTPDEKSAVVWMCWHEAQPQHCAAEQPRPPQPRLNAIQAGANLLRFVVSAAGTPVTMAAAIVTAWQVIGQWICPFLREGGIRAWWLLSAAWAALHMAARAYFTAKGARPDDPFDAETARRPPGTLLDYGTLALDVWGNLAGEKCSAPKLSGAGTRRSASGSIPLERRRCVPASGMAGVLWAVLQLPRIAVLGTACTWLYLLGGCIRNRRLLFDERIGLRNQPPRAAFPPQPTILERMACWAAQPAVWLMNVLPADGFWRQLAEAVSAQLAFWHMQRKAVLAGRRTADFLVRLEAGCGLTRKARIHFIGHSFGALAAANAARHLALERRRDFHSLCLLAPAMAADWFDGETLMLNSLTGALGCVYSRFDTANSFYYPLACLARSSAGSSGIVAASASSRPQRADWGPARPSKSLYENRIASFTVHQVSASAFACLTRPPDLLGACGGHEPDGKARCFFNLDASSIMYEGAPAAGGGHDDVFKDDVVNLMWALTQIGQRSPAPTPGMREGSGRDRI